jgi:hypothetical protein
MQTHLRHSNERGVLEMNHLRRFLLTNIFVPLTAFAMLGLGCALPSAAQAGATSKQTTALAQAPSENDVADTQEQFLKLLRLSPVLTTVVAHDPSLLADQAYVTRNNPELAQFMASHPDIAKNPEFYLFSHLNSEGGRHRDQALERAVWPDLVPADREPSRSEESVHQLIPIIVVPAFLFALVWIIRLFVEGYRSSRALKQQNEVHSRLIDKFSSSQELAAYMETEAGKQFLSASPVALGPSQMQHMPNAVARVLTPLQVGIVMVLLGIGLLLMPRQGTEMATVVLGILALMPGIGFILSAGATWILAKRLGLLPEKAGASDAATNSPISHERP